MKFARILLAVSLAAMPVLVPGAALAKRPKYHCVVINPLTPWIRNCTATVNRP